MAELTPEIVDSILAACQAGVGEANEAFSRSLDQPLSMEVGEPTTAKPDALPAGLDGPGLIVLLGIGGRAAVLLLPEATGLVPDWANNPDPTGQSKLTTLAQELGMLLLPEDLMPEQFECQRVERLDESVTRGGLGEELGVVPLTLKPSEGNPGAANLIWPLLKPDAVFGGTAEAATSSPEPPAQASAQPQSGAAAAPPPEQPNPRPQPSQPNGRRRKTRGLFVLRRPQGPPNLDDLPPYTRSLLRVKVPVIVTLAGKKQPLGRICELGPGSILQFDKSCEEMLDMCVGERLVAQGEAVKVGDKFGLRITNVILPDERFTSIHRVGVKSGT